MGKEWNKLYGKGKAGKYRKRKAKAQKEVGRWRKGWKRHERERKGHEEMEGGKGIGKAEKEWKGMEGDSWKRIHNFGKFKVLVPD